jgi:coenzyme F420 biosynthesis associated uncharacterized protein
MTKQGMINPTERTAAARLAQRWGTPLLVGALVGVGVHLVAREVEKRLDPPDGPVNWQRAERVALRLAGWGQAAEPVDWAAREAEYLAYSRRSETVIADYLGVSLPAPIERVRAVDRRTWVQTNFASLADTVGPLGRVYAAQARHPSALEAQLAGAQLGAVFGYLSRRVLGQFDLSLLSPDPEERGVLYFVEPNIRAVQEQLGLSESFRMWVALHEVTHVFEFEAYPWVRPHFRGLVERFLERAASGLSEQGAGLPQLLGRLAQGASLERHWMSWLMRPDERALFEELQALMSLVEGFSDHVMNALGRDLLPDFAAIERAVRARQEARGPGAELLERLVGLDLKRAQYKDGEAFVRQVVAARGLPFLLRVWDGPEMLPTLAELRDPARWVTRVEG